MTEFWARADLEEAAFRGDELRRLGLVTDARLAIPGMFQRGEDLSEVECDACGDGHIEHVHVIIEPPGNTPRLYIPCKEAGRVRVEPERVEVQRIDFEGLARITSNLLELSAPRVIVESRLWLLGSGHFGDRMRDVFLARGATWPDGRSLADQARLMTSPCPVILVPNRLPSEGVWSSDGRITLSMSEFDWFGIDSGSTFHRITAIVAEHDRRRSPEEALFRKDGETWVLSFQGKTVYVPDSLGLGYIAELMRKPNVAIEAAQLVGASVESSKLAALPGIELADPKTIAAARAELADKKIEFAGLKKSDWARRGALGELIAQLGKYLGEVETRTGHARKVAGTAQRSRTSATNAIRRAIEQISKQHPDLGRHLKKSIKTGTSPVYAPSELPDWDF